MLTDIGLIENYASYFTELQTKSAVQFTTNRWEDYNRIIEIKGGVTYLNRRGYRHDRNGNPVLIDNAYYVFFDTTAEDSSGEIIYGWFSRPSVNGNFKGITIGTENDLRTKIREDNLFRIGFLTFDDFREGEDFLRDLALVSLPEDWSYRNRAVQTEYPILKSYIEHLFSKVVNTTDEILYSDCERYAIFNSNLLDRYFNKIFILCHIRIINDAKTFWNPKRIGLRGLIDLRFNVNGVTVNTYNMLPKSPVYFNDIREIIFQSEWIIDNDFGNYCHIIQDRIDRFPEPFQNRNPDVLGIALRDAIECSRTIAASNYKFIVPQYRHQENKIQFLMPIYLNHSFSENPDFALVLDPNYEHRIYFPQTILPLDAAYQNARLIAKPDNYWLNPNRL